MDAGDPFRRHIPLFLIFRLDVAEMPKCLRAPAKEVGFCNEPTVNRSMKNSPDSGMYGKHRMPYYTKR
jgi:hypothetical protein